MKLKIAIQKFLIKLAKKFGFKESPETYKEIKIIAERPAVIPLTVKSKIPAGVKISEEELKKIFAEQLSELIAQHIKIQEWIGYDPFETVYSATVQILKKC